MNRLWSRIATAAGLALFAVTALHAGEIDRKDLLISGISLTVVPDPVATDVGIPAVVQTIFSGKKNDQAPPANGMTAVGDLTGPGIDTAVTIVTAPGHLFTLPILNSKGDYTLGNIRLVGADGHILQMASPSSV